MLRESSGQSPFGRTGRPRFALLGAAALVSVGYVDPGNWATDLEGGARFGYRLLWVLLASGLIATLLQTLSARLGLVTGLDLASACRRHYARRLLIPLWLLAEVAIVACDTAEVIGSAVALKLLFHVPLLSGALLTVLDVFLILALSRRGARSVELLVTALVSIIAVSLGLQVVLLRPEWGALAGGLVPHLDAESLYVAVGIVGATVMPHNLYLHSAIVPKPHAALSAAERSERLRSGAISTGGALAVAAALNAAILIVAASAFFARGVQVPDLQAAYRLLTPVLGSALGAALFAVALLCSGQSATITGTLAGQVVMQGFLRLRLSPMLRRALTRGLAIVPAALVLGCVGEGGAMPLLVASQVVLSLQLPFAIVPLVRFTSDARIMGGHANSRPVRWLALLCTLLTTGANVALVTETLARWRQHSPALAVLMAALAGAAALLLVWIGVVPLRHGKAEPSAGAVPARGSGRASA